MASEKIKAAKSDPCESGQDTVDVIDGIVITENSDGSDDFADVKPEPEFLYTDDEENGHGTLPDLNSVDPTGVMEEEEGELNRRPTRRKARKRNFGSDFATLSDDNDTEPLSWEDSNDEYQMGESSDNDYDYTIEDSGKGKRALGSKQSTVATKKSKRVDNHTTHKAGVVELHPFLITYYHCSCNIKCCHNLDLLRASR